MSTIAILQARMSSSRLPGKVMLEINGKPMIFWQIQRILQVQQIEKLIVAVSVDESDDILVNYLQSEGVAVFRGSLEDVHSRYLAIIKGNLNEGTFLRLTGDCPLTMPLLIAEMLSDFSQGNYDYYSNSIHPTYPDGLDIEIFTRESFLKMSTAPLSVADREHVTLKYRDLGTFFRIGEKRHPEDLSSMRWTVDYERDFDFVARIFEHFQGKELTFSLADVLSLLKQEPHLNSQLPGTLRNIAILKNKEETG
jgi:spore coat polysaccharide biosynthesis protein SpsF